MPSLSASSQSIACTQPRRRAQAAWPMIAAMSMASMATLWSFGCRDTREDTNYCSSCTGAETPEGTASDANAQAGSSTNPPATSEGSSNSQAPATGVKTGPAAMMSMSEPAVAGRNAQGASNAAASGGANVMPSAGTRGQAGSAARGGNGANTGARDAGIGGDGPSAPRDAGMSGPEPTPDAGNPTPVPCNGPCPNNIPVCDETMLVPRCVQCTANDQVACTGDTSTCDVGENKCVECTPDDARQCKGDKLVCNRDKHCVACTSEQPDSCPDAQPFCIDENRCVECRSNGDCPSDRSMCTADGKCVTCMNDSQCSDPARPRCDTATNGCVGCDGNNDCGRFPETRYCDNDSHRCVACTPDGESQCGVGLFCEPGAHMCVPGTPKLRNCELCRNDQECAQSPSISACIEQDNARFCSATSPSTTPFCEPGYMPATVPGRPQFLYCMPIASCSAIKSAVSETTCDDPGDCGRGGQCSMQSNGTCKLPCSPIQDCPAPLSCDQQMGVCKKN